MWMLNVDVSMLLSNAQLTDLLVFPESLKTAGK